MATSSSTARTSARSGSRKTVPPKASAKPASRRGGVSSHANSTTNGKASPRRRAPSSDADVAMKAVAAKHNAVAKAQRMEPDVSARLGSTPHTTFRGDPDIFGRLVEDHDHHRALLAMVAATTSGSSERKKLFQTLYKELSSHAAAEEQALWSSVMRNPKTTPDARHAVAEHKEIDGLLADLAARDQASPAWLRRFAKLRDTYLHHIGEEEQEQFVAAQKHLTPTDIRYMRQVFNRRKREEKAAVKVVKKIRLKAD